MILRLWFYFHTLAICVGSETVISQCKRPDTKMFVFHWCVRLMFEPVASAAK